MTSDRSADAGVEEVLNSGVPPVIQFTVSPDTDLEIGNDHTPNDTDEPLPLSSPDTQSSPSLLHEANVRLVIDPPPSTSNGKQTVTLSKSERALSGVPGKILFTYWPLTIFAIVVSITTTIALLMTRTPVVDANENIYDDDGFDAAIANKCLRVLRFNFLGVGAFRLEARAPELLATEWLAIQENACSSFSMNSTRLEQRYALLTIYFAMGGKQWGLDLQGWKDPAIQECDWKHVGCDTMDRVTALNLDVPSLAGQIPEEISRLSALSE